MSTLQAHALMDIQTHPTPNICLRGNNHLNLEIGKVVEPIMHNTYVFELHTNIVDYIS